MRSLVTTTLFVLALQIPMHSALACSAPPGWIAPTTASAFAVADAVVQVRVLEMGTDNGRRPMEVKVQTVKTFKGKYSGNVIFTANEDACGIGALEVGRDYVFFFKPGMQWFVHALDQPQGVTTEQIISDLAALKK